MEDLFQILGFFADHNKLKDLEVLEGGLKIGFDSLDTSIEY